MSSLLASSYADKHLFNRSVELQYQEFEVIGRYDSLKNWEVGVIDVTEKLQEAA